MNKPLASVAAALLLAGGVALTHYVGVLTWDRARPARPGRGDLTVMTYNVNFALADDRATRDAIGASDADVVLLQETNDAWAAAIRAQHAARYPHMRFAAPGRMRAGGLGVISRWPFEVTDVSPSDGGFFIAWRVRVHTPTGDVQMLNVHLRPQVSDGGSFVAGHFVTGPYRQREITRHLQTLQADIPAIVAGDFNEPERGAAAQTVLRQGMRSALAMYAPGARTWRWPVGPITVRQRFDHVMFESFHFECLDARVLPVGASDHLPVVARLRRRHGSIWTIH
ncbi:MAG: endonuclease/exonuclease/phosphatase family protein [Polyangiales bacterium]